MEWTIVEGDTVIGGYKCNKALTHYAGRNYEAWFTPEIDLPYGPFKFNGLPGLILEINDTAGNYKFSLYGIQKDDDGKPICEYISENIIKTKRDKFRKIYKNYCADPVKALTADGSVIIPESSRKGVKPRPYNPIELE